ncbi:MAG TPA: RHS repeat-associated core domain-containing protein [Pirellulales bacterium]
MATSQNGSGVADSRVDWFDQYGNLAWSKDERGFIQYRAFDIPTGGLVQSIEDVDTSQMTGVPAGWSTPAGGGLHLVSDYMVDSLGRTVQTLGPWHEVDIGGIATNVRRASWTVYLDSQFTVYSGQGYATLGSSSSSSSSSSSGGTAAPAVYGYVLINPVSITITDAAGRVTDQISAVRTTNPLPPTESWAAGVASQGALSSSDTFPQSSYCRWTTNQYADGTDLSTTRVYFSIPASGIGIEGVNFNQSVFGYDILDRRNRMVSPGGTITRTIFDARNLPTAVWVGTNDTGATDSDPTGGGAPGNNMVVVTEYQYDGGLYSLDGNRTQETQHVDSSTTRSTAFSFDWRDRQVQSTAAQDWYLVAILDNLSRATQVDRHAKASGNLIGRSKTFYDDRGRVYQTITYGVDPSTGNVGNSLVDNTWYDPLGHSIKTLPSGSNVFTKLVYDGACRQTAQYFGYDLTETSYADASSVADDTIVEQMETAYDAASNVIQTTFGQRFHDASGLGPLTDPSGNQPVARATYLAMYPDAVGRQQATANYGTNGDVKLVRPATIPARADRVLVDSTVINSRGEAFQAIDPAGTVKQTTFDDAGRRIELVQNYIVTSSSSSSSSSSSGASPTSDDKNITTLWTYSPDGQIATLTAVNSATGDQVTTYGYGTALPSSEVARSDILSSVTYGDGGVVKYLANRQGQTKQFTDQRLVVHAYDFDLLGRQTQDRVISLGPSSSSSSSSGTAAPGGVDGTIQRIGRTYEVRGMLQNVTSYSSAIVGQGSVVNDVQRDYNAFGQLITEYQEHSGAVNTSTSVNVQYQYADGSTNTIRPTAVVYPNGRLVSYSYGAAGEMDDALSRIASLIDSDGVTHLVDYTRLGATAFVQADSPQPQISWSLINGSGIDPYTGLDQFNRVIDNRWFSTASSSSSSSGSSSSSRSNSSGMDLDRIQHGYDRAGNRLWRKNAVADAAGVYLDELYSYDGMYRLQEMQRGQLNASYNAVVSGTLTFAQAWGLDATGNWGRFWESDSGSSWNLQQSRTSNPTNEIYSIAGGGWVQAHYDAAGNMITMPQATSPTTNYSALYDAWNRLTSVMAGTSAIETIAFDGITRRISTTVSGTTRHFYYSISWQVLEERIGSTVTPDRQFLWGCRGASDLLLRDRGSERLYAMQDDVSSTLGVVDASGEVRARYAYRPYGTVIFYDSSYAIIPSDTFEWETLCSGHRWDSAISLYITLRRVYHPILGQWGQRDRAFHIPETNLYLYTASNPLNFADRLGNVAARIRRPNGDWNDIFNDFLENGSRHGDDCVDIPFEEFHEWMLNHGYPVSDEALYHYNRGCIGLCAIAQHCGVGKGAATWPERARDTKCYASPAGARRRRCPEGKKRFVFLKEGFWRHGQKPKPRGDDSVPIDSVFGENGTGHYNYITFISGFCVWMDTGGPDPQTVTICRQSTGPCTTLMEENEDWPARMWCVTCVQCDKKERR